jgi:hypothetical protein
LFINAVLGQKEQLDQMPSIKITDGVDTVVDVIPAPDSALIKYFKNLSDLSIDGTLLTLRKAVTLEDPAVKTVTAGVTFAEPVDVGTDQVDLKIGVGVNGSIGIFKPDATDSQLFDPDPYGDPITVDQDDRYVSFGVTATINPAIVVGSGDLKFGFSAGASSSITNYHRFPTKPTAPSLIDAVTSTIAEFVIPADIEDFESLPVGSVVAINGTGSLKVSGTVNLLAAINPLASASLPAPLPAVALKAGGSIAFGADVQITGEYQIRVIKSRQQQVRLGYYRKSGTAFSIKATASAGIAANVGDGDILGQLISAISSDAKTDADELRKGGLPPDQIQGIQEAIKASIARTLEIAISAELGSSQQETAAFLYDIDISSLSPLSRAALHRALDGDLAALTGQATSMLPGVRAIRDIFSNIRESKYSLTVNLLGIVNYGWISKLLLAGKTLYDPITGQLVISDTATAARIASTVMNVSVANSEKLRQVMAENFLITIAYRGAKASGLQPSLTTAHSFFALNDHTSPETLKDELDVNVGLGLMGSSEQEYMVQSAPEFGRTLFYAATTYDNTLSTQLFLDGDRVRPVEFFESAGLQALKSLVHEGDVDEARRRPAEDPGLWQQMKELGQPSIPSLFRAVPDPVVAAIVSDYTVISWWSEAMNGTAAKLATIQKFLATHPTVDDENNDFKRLRADLASHLRSVAATTKEEFGRPWGLLAMFNASGKQAGRKVTLVGSTISILKEVVLQSAAATRASS